MTRRKKIDDSDDFLFTEKNSYEKRVVVVAGILARLLRDNVERWVARGRRSAVVISVVIQQYRILAFPTYLSIAPGSARRRAARALGTFARGD